MSVEGFTAVAMCPACRSVAVHLLSEPRFRPTGDSPLADAQRYTVAILDAVNVLTLGLSASYWDPPGTTVARVCVGCGHRWAQR